MIPPKKNIPIFHHFFLLVLNTPSITSLFTPPWCSHPRSFRRWSTTASAPWSPRSRRIRRRASRWSCCAPGGRCRCAGTSCGSWWSSRLRRRGWGFGLGMGWGRKWEENLEISRESRKSSCFSGCFQSFFNVFFNDCVGLWGVLKSRHVERFPCFFYPTDFWTQYYNWLVV